VTDDYTNLPIPPWWNSREARHEARELARRARRETRAAVRAGVDVPAAEAPARLPVTPERVADAALRVIDAQGLDGLTVRALAQELGVGTMTLYWYVQNKDEILDLVADRMLAGLAFGDGESGRDWRESVREGSRAVRAAFLRHARAVPTLVGHGSFGPNGLKLTDASIGVFRAAGFSPDDAADAYFTLSNFVTGFCTFETAGLAVKSRPDVDMKAYGQLIQQYVDSLPAGSYPNLRTSAPRIFGASLDDRFGFGIDCLIDGLEAKLKAGSGSAGQP
jgi:TetR/AcrR family transcriptional regulator, tetracycline repressor protein